MQTAPQPTPQTPSREASETVPEDRAGRSVGWYDPDRAAWDPDPLDNFEALRPAAARPRMDTAEGARR